MRKLKLWSLHKTDHNESLPIYSRPIPIQIRHFSNISTTKCRADRYFPSSCVSHFVKEVSASEISGRGCWQAGSWHNFFLQVNTWLCILECSAQVYERILYMFSLSLLEFLMCFLFRQMNN